MTTPLDAIVSALEAAASYNASAEAAPEAVLWCDPGHEFASLLPGLRDRLHQLLTYGDPDLAIRSGPAVWVRAAVARTLPGFTLPESVVPIVYVPGVGRDVLRGAEDCPPLLQPLVWLTVSGTLFGHVNGKDWTLRGVLSAERGPLRLTIPDDAATREALGHAAARLCVRPLSELKGKRWDADALNALLAPDVAADMLDWMEGAFDAKADPGRFAAFAALAVKELAFDPRKLSAQDAARRLVRREGAWSGVWTRFASGLGREKIVGLLSVEEPPDMLADKTTYPRLNANAEAELRNALAKLENLASPEAAAGLVALEKAHAWRRETVWARRGEAPLAQALKHLAVIAMAKPLPTHDAEALANAYAHEGCLVDQAALSALAAAPREKDRGAITAALRTIYLPWVDDAANALQALLRDGKARLALPAKPDGAETMVFVDGLRMDVARELERLLRDAGMSVDLRWAWSGFPTVTATCKPLVSPVADRLSGNVDNKDATPETVDGKSATKKVLYGLMEEGAGWVTEETLLPQGKLWLECGRFDEEGHALGARLAERIASAAQDVADRIIQVARGGRRVRIVTDHGWLLMPGGLPLAKLDVGLTEPDGKRSRCARVKPGAPTSYLQLPWTWNKEVFMATATGARAFFAGQEYAHGGVSPQECVLPVMDVEATAAAAKSVTITKAIWSGLRLRIEVDNGVDLLADLRFGIETSGPSVVDGGRVLDESGKTSMLVNDAHQGKQVCLVILDDVRNAVAHRTLIVGGE